MISDFRMRRNAPYYINDEEHVEKMEIIPIKTSDLKNVIRRHLSYAQLYKIFQRAYNSVDITAPPLWYKTYIESVISGQNTK